MSIEIDKRVEAYNMGRAEVIKEVSNIAKEIIKRPCDFKNCDQCGKCCAIEAIAEIENKLKESGSK